MSNNKRERLGSYNLNTRIACIYTLLFQWGRQHWRVVKLVTLSKEMEVLFSFLPFIPCIALSHLRPDCKCYPRLKRQKAYNWKKKNTEKQTKLVTNSQNSAGWWRKGGMQQSRWFLWQNCLWLLLIRHWLLPQWMTIKHGHHVKHVGCELVYMTVNSWD